MYNVNSITVSDLTATLAEFCLYGTNYPHMKLILTPWFVFKSSLTSEQLLRHCKVSFT